MNLDTKSNSEIPTDPTYYLEDKELASRLKGCHIPILSAKIVSIGAFTVTVHPSLFIRSFVTIAALAADLQAAKLIQPHHGGGDQGSLLPRSMRLEVPKFNGTGPDS
ncbi:hypothetical protein Tco_0057436 [Tanacetum coccineum]